MMARHFLPPFTTLSRASHTVITGYNTDIEFGGVTYHVQTEDKGLAKPMIMSLVYDRGTILASKRSSYADIVEAFDEKVLAERLQKQHSLICAAVRAGRIDDLRQMSARDALDAKQKTAPDEMKISRPPENLAPAETGSQAPVEAVEFGEPEAGKSAETLEVIRAAQAPSETAKQREGKVASAAAATTLPAGFDAPIPKPAINGYSARIDVPDASEDHGSEVFDEYLIFPDEGVEIIDEPRRHDKKSNDFLSIELLGGVGFKSGETRSIGFMVCRASGSKVVSDAEIMVKILGSSFRPLIFHARTDANGVARVNVQFPSFNSGRAVFLVRAISGGDEVELRRPILHG